MIRGATFHASWTSLGDKEGRLSRAVPLFWDIPRGRDGAVAVMKGDERFCLGVYRAFIHSSRVYRGCNRVPICMYADGRKTCRNAVLYCHLIDLLYRLKKIGRKWLKLLHMTNLLTHFWFPTILSADWNYFWLRSSQTGLWFPKCHASFLHLSWKSNFGITNFIIWVKIWGIQWRSGLQTLYSAGNESVSRKKHFRSTLSKAGSEIKNNPSSDLSYLIDTMLIFFNVAVTHLTNLANESASPLLCSNLKSVISWILFNLVCF